MAWRYHNFGCICGHEYVAMIDNRPEHPDHKPDPCPECGAEGATLLAGGKVNAITSYVPDYPGANIHRAGYADLRRAPEKKGRQISMHTAGKKTLNAPNVPSVKPGKRAG